MESEDTRYRGAIESLTNYVRTTRYTK